MMHLMPLTSVDGLEVLDVEEYQVVFKILLQRVGQLLVRPADK